MISAHLDTTWLQVQLKFATAMRGGPVFVIGPAPNPDFPSQCLDCLVGKPVMYFRLDVKMNTS